MYMPTPRPDAESAQPPQRRQSMLARATGGLLLALVCAGVAACGPAASDPAASGDTAEAGTLDTSRLPRTAGARQIYANALSTVYSTAVPVAEAAGTIEKALTTDGWQRYVAPFTDYAKSPDFQIMSFKKGPKAIHVSVTRAPAQGNATSVSYTAIVLTNDLPVPTDATEIAFDPERPYLSCLTAMPVAAALDTYTRELAAMGFALWPGLAQQVANKSGGAEAQKAAHAYFVRDNQQPLHLVLHRDEQGKTKVEIEAVSAEVLTAELAPDPTPSTPQSRYRAKRPADAMDKMIDNAMRQMTEAILTAAGEAVASVGKPTGTAAKPKAPAMPAMPQMPEMSDMPAMPGEEDGGVAGAAAAPADIELVAEDMDGFPIPENHTSTHSGKTKYRSERETTVPAPLASVLAFYRRELPKRGFKEMDMVVEGDITLLKVATPSGQGALKLTESGGETAVSFIERREAEAKKAGIMPKSGHAKLVFGSMAETPATVTIGTKTIKIAPGMGGGERPDGPMLDLAPGKYAYAVAVPGAPPSNEEVVVAEGEAWALVIGPGGGSMPLHMY